MAIELPRAGPGSAGTGGRARTVRQPTAADVPTVSVTADPAVTIPNVAQFDPVADVGAAISDVGQAATVAQNELVAASLRINERKEGVARNQADTLYFGQLNERFRVIQESAAFADDPTITAAGQEARADMEKILGDYVGSDIGREILANQLNKRFEAFADKLAGESIAAGNAQVDQSMIDATDGIVADMLTNPDFPLEYRFGQLDEKIIFMGLPGERADAARALGRETIGVALLERVITQGDIDDEGLMMAARTLMENPSLREAIPSVKRTAFANRIYEIENTIQRVGIEARVEVAKYGAIADSLGLTGDAKTDFIIGVMGGGSASVSEKQMALTRLVDAGQMDPNTADKIMSGTFKVVSVYNEAGDPVNMLVDLSQVGDQGAVMPVEEVAAELPPEPDAVPELPPAPDAVPAETTAEPDADLSIWGIVTGERAVTGLVPAITAAAQGITGQFGVDVAEAELLLLRDTLDHTLIPLATKLVPNERFPVAQVEFVLEKADIETGMGTDRKSLATSVLALNDTVHQLWQQATADSTDPSLPRRVQQAQRQNAGKLKNFMEFLNVPPGTTAADIEALGEPTEGASIPAFIGGVGDAINELTSTETPVEPEAITEVPPVIAINKMTEAEVRELVQNLDRSALITDAQVKAIKKKLGVE